MSRAAGRSMTTGDKVVIVATVFALALVAFVLTAMTSHTGRASCAATTNPSTSAPVGGDCGTLGSAATG